MLASAAQFVAGTVEQRVLSLQNIGSELDEAQLQAWHDLVRILAHEMMNSLTPIASLAESVRPLVAALRSGAGPSGGQHVADVAGAIDTMSAVRIAAPDGEYNGARAIVAKSLRNSQETMS